MRQGPNSLFVDGHPTFHRNPWNGYISPYYFGWWPSAIVWKTQEFSPRTCQPIPYQFSLHHYSYSTHGYPKWCFGKRWLLFKYVDVLVSIPIPQTSGGMTGCFLLCIPSNFAQVLWQKSLGPSGPIDMQLKTSKEACHGRAEVGILRGSAADRN